MRHKTKKQKIREDRADNEAWFGTHIRETVQEFRRLFGKQKKSESQSSESLTQYKP